LALTDTKTIPSPQYILSPDAWKILLGTVLGSILAVVGGLSGEYLKVRMQNRRERNYISINLNDELHEITEIIGKFNETFVGSGVANKKYVIDLKNSMSLYDGHKQRFYMFKSAEIRKEINGFYKKLNNLINETESQVGSLDTSSDSKALQKEIVQRYINLKSESETLSGKLKVTKKFWDSGN
jgi:hypothetical protein